MDLPSTVRVPGHLFLIDQPPKNLLRVSAALGHLSLGSFLPVRTHHHWPAVDKLARNQQVPGILFQVDVAGPIHKEQQQRLHAGVQGLHAEKESSLLSWGGFEV